MMNRPVCRVMPDVGSVYITMLLALITGLAALTPGTDRTRSSVAVESMAGESSRARATSTWAYAPITFSIRVLVKPSITASTTMSANTPSATPAMEIRVMAETSALCWPENR